MYVYEESRSCKVIMTHQIVDMQLGWEDATSALLERQMKG